MSKEIWTRSIKDHEGCCCYFQLVDEDLVEVNSRELGQSDEVRRSEIIMSVVIQKTADSRCVGGLCGKCFLFSCQEE